MDFQPPVRTQTLTGPDPGTTQLTAAAQTTANHAVVLDLAMPPAIVPITSANPDQLAGPRALTLVLLAGLAWWGLVALALHRRPRRSV